MTRAIEVFLTLLLFCTIYFCIQSSVFILTQVVIGNVHSYLLIYICGKAIWYQLMKYGKVLQFCWRLQEKQTLGINNVWWCAPLNTLHNQKLTISTLFKVFMRLVLQRCYILKVKNFFCTLTRYYDIFQYDRTNF